MSARTVVMPRVLLPRGCDMTKWATVACDQFTSDRGYWERLDAFVGDAPSALRLILPECYLGDPDATARENAIPAVMRDYAARGLFAPADAFVFVKRTFASGKVRHGLVAAVDLCDYDYRKGNTARIRATEGTVESRLPPRVQIRAHSPLELPHIMLLIDDPKNILFTAVEKARGETLYDFDLSAGGGHVTGNAVTDERAVSAAFAALSADMRARYDQDLLLLVGDGNHSLAAAKKCYEQALAAGDPDAPLKRYALCEIVNLYDDGIAFEPIHRAAYGDPAALAEKLIRATREFDVPAVVRGGGKEYTIRLPQNAIEAVSSVQSFLESEGCEVDYIHGTQALKAQSERSDCLAIPLPPIRKDGFTSYILQNGILPKKTFSMGEAEEKRYYLEARCISSALGL